MTSTTPQHKLLAMALLVAVLVMLLLMLVLPAAIMGKNLDGDIAFKQLQLQKLLQAEVQLQQLEKHGSTRTNEIGKNNFIQAANASLAAAQLQSTLKNMVESSRGIVLRTQIIDDPSLQEEQLPFIPISLLMQIRGDINALQNILYQIQQQQPALFISRLHIDNRQFSHRQQNVASIPLTAAITVHGYMADENN